MKVAEILANKGSKVVTARPEAAMADVVATLAEKGVGAVVISRDGRTVHGLVAERTVIKGLAQHGTALFALAAKDVMDAKPSLCRAGDDVKQVMQAMTLRRARHLPVVDAQDRLCGIISIGDVVKSRLDDLELEAGVLRDVVIAGH